LRIEVNGEPRELAGEIVLSELVKDLELAPERVAVELNKKVVRRIDWPMTAIADGDRIEIVHFVGGGGEAGKARRAKRQD
jgi:thiamine biosynthesis protein ThiS